MSEFLLQFAAWLREFLPVKIIRPDEQGSLMRGARAAGTLGPGVYLFRPWYDMIRVYGTAYQQVDLPCQVVTTADDVPVLFSANIGYRVVDAQAMDLAVVDLDVTLTREAAGWMATKIADRTYQELRGDRAAIQRALRESLARRVDQWGVKIEVVMLTDFSRARVYRVVGNPAVSPCDSAVTAQ